ncbi:hypothetical protein DOTSEDRAFT_69623 [Dothistroma septosporum NZE10]|uniref:Pathway-specific nitrogen regulator n=1 Tax=Dothistroma septosporum (strain NZE10 / CBS 128990) TaxID=675120 RepID=N1PW58_DOTSN|nr:hypothetical protein DOTSEDRAFT_69623 [Dothistroma septosporum NZE10]
MARPSKTHQSIIYQDTCAPSHDPSHDPPTEYDDVLDENIEEDGVGKLREENTLKRIKADVEPSNIDLTDTEREDGRRESAVTSASISSLPESYSEPEYTHVTPVYTACSPQMIRSSFRRLDSRRRLQMTSLTTPFERSPRRSVLHSRSRAGTPRCNQGSPTMKKRYEEPLEPEEERTEYPLVLLHVTLLPTQLRWSVRSMQDLLPENLLQEYRLLRSKISETVAQRGILILHPRDDYELLEERLLEALELKEERITKCGHFRAQGSISSISSGEESMDSAIGSSIMSSSGDICSTCHHRVEGRESPSEQKWSIKVYAANGLMRASAWSATWSEMERIDVEILPWISDELRRALDARLQQELEEQLKIEEEEARSYNVAKEQARSLSRSDEFAGRNVKEHHFETKEEIIFDSKSQPLDDLPPIYPRKDIPLSVLLKNYLYLLAQDKRNIAMLGLTVLTLWVSLRTALVSTAAEGPALPTIYEHGHQRTLTSDVPAFVISSGDDFAPKFSPSGGLESTRPAATAAERTMMPHPAAIHELQDEKETLVKADATSKREFPSISPAELVQASEDNANETCDNAASLEVLFGQEQRS